MPYQEHVLTGTVSSCLLEITYRFRRHVLHEEKGHMPQSPRLKSGSPCETINSWNWLSCSISISLSLSGNAPQPDFSRGIEAYVPSPHGEHAAETDILFLAVQLNRLTPQGSALPFQVWTLFRGMRAYIVSHWGSQCISSLKIGVLLLPQNPIDTIN